MRVLMWSFFFFALPLYVEMSDLQDDGLLKTPKGNLYALLVAGSNGWWNYRHQADTAHAFQLLKKNGVPEDNIIVMMYDDIADDPDNPFPGKLFNRPHGPDVYAGLKIDYKGDSVTPGNFLNVLQGNAQNVTGGNGRVINSTSHDRIFVYFTDHGGDGLIAFPDDILTKEDLNTALQNMYEDKRYDEFVFYLEACESVYAMTASNPDESSWGTYCDNDMNLPCLGDLFSVNWMQDSEAVQFYSICFGQGESGTSGNHNVDVETLLVQFKDVRTLTNLSHVMQYGDLKITKETIGTFEGSSKKKIAGPSPLMEDINQDEHQKVSWPSRDIELMHLQKLLKTTNDALMSKVLEQRISKIFEDRYNIEALFDRLVASLLSNANDRKRMIEERNVVEDLKCHNDVVKAFDSICVDVNKFDYALKYMYVLNNLCKNVHDSMKIINAMHTTCSTIGEHYL
ncbi:unnamed protein product [Angiostrongylus costaricensis]|uniref:legumain n=1 Tax=Angiostrongylus costaricensis TaxID=334426 RepID=A0A158PD99_ANGCS|nr:unnamed protein product [Angiostrongylus costaricensis]